MEEIFEFYRLKTKILTGREEIKEGIENKRYMSFAFPIISSIQVKIMIMTHNIGFSIIFIGEEKYKSVGVIDYHALSVEKFHTLISGYTLKRTIRTRERYLKELNIHEELLSFD
jgi:hypothetical protein